MIHPRLKEITDRIVSRSADSRQDYLLRMKAQQSNAPQRAGLACTNLAHGFAACSVSDKQHLASDKQPNLGIITAYNDMLSAHQPYENYPQIIREIVREVQATAQVAGGVPAMCDGVTQGQPAMDLSLFSRDLIAMSAAVGLSHGMFDAAVFLGVCDKIVPGLLIGALTFGHLPAIFLPAGPMTSGLPNDEKSRTRQLFVEGKATREELLASESASYHSPGTCTFYGTANSNQMLMEIMGLHMPGSSFINPLTPLRDALMKEAVKQVIDLTAQRANPTPLYEIIDERAIVNGVVGLHATGGSTNHTMHLVAIAAAAGIQLTWQDISEISEIVPLLVRVYPNGKSDVNHFEAAGGMGFLIRELIEAGLLHKDVKTVNGTGLDGYTVNVFLDDNGNVLRKPAPAKALDETVLATAKNPFNTNGGLKVLTGNLGAAIIKSSAVAPDRYIIEAPAQLFHTQEDVEAAFKAGQLNKDVVVVLRYMGPKACGMPEAHKLTPPLSVVQNRGYKVALVTDGRMSGASGKIPAAIHVTPEAMDGGLIAKVQDGDILRLDAVNGTLDILVPVEELSNRSIEPVDFGGYQSGIGRELFASFRANVSSADSGARVFNLEQTTKTKNYADPVSAMETV
ncbi:phosphogluconate dehydratase [Pseudovibrio sp. Tun.PSC04-5.I4]|uniref:phosphogluconate dehydratase n=1 Tax=Pseudovibrio sp. Tun.PSC04-5.I4 TaxID=1798213 RepID=UPI000891A326|nr:phosphogluconate dehydratase [Pseudovibrio sp. Tun.PSC04-5.I4]SDR36611.1 6-phosphogluconate dehydratase [Pseudovibrio sp. Tun.PSC04-5.I4]